MKNVIKDEAVSPVIGVILMVAVTVILAAIVANLVISMGSTLQKTKVVATTIEQLDTDIRITYIGGTNDPDLTYIAITAPNGTVYNTTSQSGGLAPTGTPVRPDVGSVMTLTGAATSGDDHVIIVGHFNDGTVQVLLEKYI